MSKRQRSGPGPRRGSARAIDKKIAAVLKTGNGTTQISSTMATFTYPATISGLRWSLATFAADTEAFFFYWAIVVLREGETLGS